MILYALRLILVFVWGIITSTIGFFISLSRPFHPNNDYRFAKIFAPLAQKIMGLKYEVRGHHHMYLNNPCIYISNHQQNLDLIAGCTVLTPRSVSLGKQDLKLVPFFGQFYWLAGNILIDRHNHRKAVGAMDQVRKEIIERKINVWIMPEGTRNKTNILKPFKKGAFVTAINAQVPIIPIAVSTYDRHLDFTKWKAGRVIIDCMPPLFTEGLTLEDAEPLAQRARELIGKKIQELDAENKHLEN